MAEGKRAVVIDLGSSQVRAGKAGDHKPCYIPSVVGFPKNALQGMDRDLDMKIGDAAIAMRARLDLSRPVKRGVISQWQDIGSAEGSAEDLLSHALYTRLGVNPAEQPLMMCEAPGISPADREKMAQLCFERFHVPSMFSANQAVLTLYAAGRLNGVALSSGYGVTYAVAVNEGYAVPGTRQRLDVAGGDIDDYLEKLAKESGFEIGSESTKIKEEFCRVALDPTAKVQPQSYCLGLPEKRVVTFGAELTQAPEVLFSPWILNVKGDGVHKMVKKCIDSCPDAVKAAVSEEVIMSGGTSLFCGFRERLDAEMKKVFEKPPQVFIPQERLNSSWIGGSILACLPTFAGLCVTAEEYNEHGPSIINEKCPNEK